MIEVGDTVEYCFDNPNYKHWHGSIGRVVGVTGDASRHGYSYQCDILWESGPLTTHKTYGSGAALPFWDVCFRKVDQYNYDPTQMGDKDDDI